MMAKKHYSIIMLTFCKTKVVKTEFYDGKNNKSMKC